MKTEVSIIIVNYNCEEHICNCIDSIYKFVSEPEFEIIIVDNASADNSVRIIKERYPSVKLIVNELNVGFGAANNVGAQHANGNYLFFLNPDTFLLNNGVLDFFRFLEESEPEVACCGGNLVQKDGSLNRSFGNLPSFFQEFSEKGAGKLFKKYYKKHLSIGKSCDFSNIKQVPYLVGADIFIRKSAFENVSGFDPGFFMYFEETDLFYRLKNKGYLSFILPETRIIHIESVTMENLQTFNYKWWALFEKSRYYYYKKHYGSMISLLVKMMQIGSFMLNHFFGTTPIDTKRALQITLKA